MALSQLQCLDENNVNPRTHESKADFFYCEDQRLALETLLSGGRETFFKYLESRGLRGFLSDLELEALAAAAETYDPGKDVFPEGGEDEPTPLSQHYWPDLSDTSVPEMDLGWPDSEGYRGVTRTTVYTQPPLDGQAHIKEVVRRMIAQAQKVIGVVMDIFTDVDIFRDLLDVGFKKKVSVYILLEHTHLPHFMSMCRRANMHRGHLKHLRVRCTEGAEFYTRSCRKVRGRMGHRFMFVDGDKAVSGSYSFTWMSSRLDRNLITVTTGQAVDGFDRVFRYLYANSRSVDLRQVVMEPEPEPEVLPQPVTVMPNAAAVARKMYNPKYALVAASNPSPTTSLGRESPKEPETSDDPKKKRRRKVVEEDPLPVHPGLVNLEKAYLIPYLPTWPEPDPSSDVIGFINIRDANRPTQVHLQRSEMFETSQAIKFSSPFSKPTEILPDVAKPRQMTINTEDLYKQQPAPNKIKSTDLEVNKTGGFKIEAKEFQTDKVLPTHISGTISTEKAPESDLPASMPKSQFEKHAMRALNTDNKLYAATNQVPGSGTPHVSASSGLGPNYITSGPIKGTASQMTESLSRSSSRSDSLTQSDGVSGVNTGVQVYRAHTLESKSTNTSQLPGFSGFSSESKVEPQEQNVALRTHSYTQAVPVQPHNVSSSAAASSMLLPESDPTSTTMLSNETPGASVFTPTASSLRSAQHLTRQNPSRSPSTSSSLTSPHPVPKPRTVQLLIKDNINNSQVCLVKKPTEPRVVQNDSPVQTAASSSSVTRPDSKTDTQMSNEHTGTTKEPASPKESLTSKDTKSKEADGRPDGEDSHQCKDRAGRTTVKVSPETLSDPEKRAVSTPADRRDASQQRSQSNCEQVICKTGGHVEAPDKTLRLPGLYTQSPDPESRSVLSPVRTLTPDRFPPLVTTPDSRTPTPDLPSHTPDFPTPTPGISDGYVSSRDDSNLSTTSEEYYECSDSPFHDPVFDQMYSSAVPAYRNHSPVSATLGPNDMSSIWSKTLAGSDRGSASSVIDKRVKTRQPEDEENEKVKEEKLAKPSMVRRAEQETDRRDGVEADRLLKYENSTQIAEKVKEPCSPKKKGGLNQLGSDRRAPPGGSCPVGTSRTRLSSGDLKPVRVTADGDRPAKVPSGREKGSSQERLRSREKSLTRRETEEQKRAQQHDGGTPSSRPPRPGRPLTGIQYTASRLWENRALNQTESKVLEVLESRKSPSRTTPPGAAGSAAGQKQAHSSQQGGAPRQPPAVQGRTRAGQTQSQAPPQKPPASFLATHTNTQLLPGTGSKVAPAAEALGQDEGKVPFSLTFSKLYNLTGLRDKMNKAPAQGKRGSSRSPAESQQSTS